MKGLIVREEAAKSTLEALRGNIFEIDRIVVPEANNLVITPYGGEVHAYENFNFSEEASVIKEIEVPQEIVDLARNVVRAKVELNLRENEIRELLKP